MLLFILINGKLIIMTIITFKDGVSVKLHEDGSLDFLEASNSDVDFNFHFAMAMSENFSDNERHIDMLFKKINRRLGGVLTA